MWPRTLPFPDRFGSGASATSCGLALCLSRMSAGSGAAATSCGLALFLSRSFYDVEESPSPSWPVTLSRGHHFEQAFDERSARMSSSAGRLRHEPSDERSALKVHLAGHLRTRLPVPPHLRDMLHALHHYLTGHFTHWPTSNFSQYLCMNTSTKIHDGPRSAGKSIAVNPKRKFHPKRRSQDPSR